MASFSAATAAFTTGSVEPVDGEFVSSDYFSLLGVRPIVGRAFDASLDEAATAEPVVLLGHDLWKRRFGGDSVIGRKVTLNGIELTVIGVLPAGFNGLSGRASLWMPAPIAVRVTYADYLVTNQSFISVVGRLRPAGRSSGRPPSSAFLARTSAKRVRCATSGLKTSWRRRRRR